MQLKSTKYLSHPGLVKCFWAATSLQTSLYNYKSLIKLVTIGFDSISLMLWIWSCQVSTKELLFKIAVPKWQTKFLKSNCEVVSFYYICKLYNWNALQTIFSQAFLKDFAKVFLNGFADFLLYGIVKNLIIPINPLRRSFLIFFSLSIYHSSPFFIKSLDQLLSENTFLCLFQLIHVWKWPLKTWNNLLK